MFYLSELSNKADYRVIYTGLYGNIAFMILRGIEDQLTDNRWENFDQMEKYWKNELVLLNSESDPEIVIIIKKRPLEYKTVETTWNVQDQKFNTKNVFIKNPFINMDEMKIRSWFADKIKSIVTYEMKDNDGKNWWIKNEEQELEYFSCDDVITVKDCKMVYKALKGIKNDKM
jgi:hypothetical protein